MVKKDEERKIVNSHHLHNHVLIGAVLVIACPSQLSSGSFAQEQVNSTHNRFSLPDLTGLYLGSMIDAEVCFSLYFF